MKRANTPIKLPTKVVVHDILFSTQHLLTFVIGQADY